MTPVYANDFRGRTEPRTRSLSASLKLSGLALIRLRPEIFLLGHSFGRDLNYVDDNKSDVVLLG